MPLDEIVIELSPALKMRGFTKRRLTWSKQVDDITLFFFIQKSQFSKEIWYYNFGLSINAMLNEKKPQSFSDCHLWDRVDCSTKNHVWAPKEIIYLLEKWEDFNGSMHKLHNNATHGKYPEFVKTEAVQYISNWYKKEL